jgi:hypothetical protein
MSARLQPQDSALQIEWLTDPAQLEELSEDWNALESEVRDRTVLSTFNFLVTWYRHYAGEYGGIPLIGLARRGKRLIGIAPLTLRDGTVGKIPVRRVEFAPNDSPVGAFLVADDHPEAVGALLNSLVHTVKFDVICLNGFDPVSNHLRTLQKSARRCRLAIELEDQASAVADLRQGYPKYRAGLSGHYRLNLNQKAKKIVVAGGAKIDGVLLKEGVETTDSSIKRMIAITEASYKLKGQRLADNHRRYLSELGQRFGPQGMLSLTILSIGGQDAAYLFGLVERGCFYDINLAYVESFQKLSPGAFLMQQTMEKLAASGIHTVVSHGAHEYKKHWATQFVTQNRVFLFPYTVKATTARLVRFSFAPFWQRFRASDAP